MNYLHTEALVPITCHSKSAILWFGLWNQVIQFDTCHESKICEPKLDTFLIKLPKYTAPRFSFLNEETCYT